MLPRPKGLNVWAAPSGCWAGFQWFRCLRWVDVGSKNQRSRSWNSRCSEDMLRMCDLEVSSSSWRYPHSWMVCFMENPIVRNGWWPGLALWLRKPQFLKIIYFCCVLRLGMLQVQLFGVLEPPLWKIYDFVSRDDEIDEIPKGIWEQIATKPPTSFNVVTRKKNLSVLRSHQLDMDSWLMCSTLKAWKRIEKSPGFWGCRSARGVNHWAIPNKAVISKASSVTPKNQN